MNEFDFDDVRKAAEEKTGLKWKWIVAIGAAAVVLFFILVANGV